MVFYQKLLTKFKIHIIYLTMKKKNSVKIFLFFFVFSFTQAQQKVIDSLEQELIKPTNGLSKVENLNWLGYYYARTNPEKGLKKLDKSITLAIKNNDSLQLGKAYEYKGINHKNLGNDSLMLSFFSKAEYVYKQIDNKGALPFLILNRGIFYQQRSNYQKANEDCHSALIFFSSDKDTLLMGYTLGRIGFNNIYLGDYTSSLKSFQKGAYLLEQINKDESMHYASIQGDMGLLYQKLSDYNTALEHHNRCLEIYKKYDFQRGISNQYNDIGNIYTKLEKFEKALNIYKTSYNMKKKTKNKKDIANALSNIGITHSHLKQFDKALIYLDSSIVIYKQLKDFGSLSSTHKNLGNIFLKKNQLQKAAMHFDYSLEYAKNSDDKRAIYLAKEGLSEIAFVNGNYKNAYTLQQESLTLKENILSDEKRNELANIKAKFEYEKKEAILEAVFENEKTIDEAKIKHQILVRNFSIGSGIIISLFLFFFLKQKHQKDKLKEVYSTETRISQKVHDELANDMYHVINKIQNKTDDNQNDVVDQLENIYQRTRDISYEHGSINLNNDYFYIELKEMIDSYQSNNIKISTIGLTKAFWDTASNHKKIAITRVLKELMTNMKKHSKASQVVITFKKNKQNLLITYADNGIGFKKTEHFKNNGLQNAESRIKNINGSLNFDSDRKMGVGITISFPT